MFLPYSDSASEALKQAKQFARKEQYGYIGTEHLLLGLFRAEKSIAAEILSRHGFKTEAFLQLVREFVMPGLGNALLEREGFSPKVREALEEAEKLAQKYNSQVIDTQHILASLMHQNDSVAVRLLATMGLNCSAVWEDAMSVCGADSGTIGNEVSSKKSRDSKKKGPSVLEQFTRDLTKLAKEGKLDPVVGREEEITRVMEILSRRTKNNPCLVGEPGVGKTAVVEALAQRMASGNVPFTIQGKRLLMLDLPGMIAGTKYRGEFEERVKKLVEEVVEDGQVLLFLDELHTLIGAGGAEGAIDASNILKPSLARGELQLIGATTLEEYRKHIEKDAALERRFQSVDVNEPDEAETLAILKGIAPGYEKHHMVVITEEALEAAVKLSGRYIHDRRWPDKAIDLVDEACASVRLKSIGVPTAVLEAEAELKELDLQIAEALKAKDFESAAVLADKMRKTSDKAKKGRDRFEKKLQDRSLQVTEKDVTAVTSRWTKIPLQKLEEKESERLLRLEKIIGKRVVGQSEAVNAVARAVRRGRVGLQDPRRPIASFLFMGPTGVGKTELSKALAEVMFGTEDALIRVDMSEYMEGHSVSKMIGSPPGYVGFDEGGQLSEKIRRNPYSVVLFDEIEKAHPDVFNVLLQVLDDGHITDSKGRKVSFKNTIIIMTSNVGAKRIVEPKSLGFGSGSTKEQKHETMKQNVMEEVKKLFKPEFINRIDEMIVFHQLEKEDMHRIVTLLSDNLVKRCREQLQITLRISAPLKNYLVEKYTDLKMGARPLKRAIQTEVEDLLTDEILSGKIKSGDTVTATVKNNQVVFTVK